MNNKLSKSKFNIKRVVAAALSLKMLINGMTLSASAENRVKTFAKEHPVITSVSSMTGAIPVLFGVGALIRELCKTKNIEDTHTPVDDIPDSEIQDYLNEQIDKFIAYGKDGDTSLFAVSDAIKNEADPRALALVIKSINMIFEKFEDKPFFLNALKSKLKKGNHTLLIDWGKDNMYREFFCSLNTLAYSGAPYVFEINKMYARSFSEAKNFAKNRNTPQGIVIWNIGFFFNECVMGPSQQLTIDRIFNLARIQNPSLNKNNQKFKEEVLIRCQPNPFAELLADYVLEKYPESDIFMQPLKTHINFLKNSFNYNASNSQ